MPTSPINTCLGNLLTTSVLAYNNKDLLPNGFINLQGTTVRQIVPPRLSNPCEGESVVKYSDLRTINLLPTQTIYAEFWYTVQSTITGTKLKDAGGSLFNGPFGAYIPADIGLTPLGDLKPIITKWVFHLAESETKLNREYTLQQSDFFIDEDGKERIRIGLTDYVLTVLGVTLKPINFVKSNRSIPDDVRISAFNSSACDNLLAEKPKTADGVATSVLSLDNTAVATSNLSDTAIAEIANVEYFDELDILGNGNNRMGGWTQSNTNQLQANFRLYKYDRPYNFFNRVDRDFRKNYFRADNQFDRTNGHVDTNPNEDDLSDKNIIIEVAGTKQKDIAADADITKITEESIFDETTIKLAPGDKVYISYVGGKSLVRHSIETRSLFALLGFTQAVQIPPFDNIRGVNFKIYPYALPRDLTRSKATYDEYLSDYRTKIQINQARSSLQSSPNNQQLTQTIRDLQNKLILKDVEGQRIIEAKAIKTTRKPYILGCYFIDSRGICSLNFRTGRDDILIPFNEISDQEIAQQIFNDIRNGYPQAFDADGKLLIFEAQNFFFDDFYFDVSSITNTLLRDNEKYGYERRLAEAIKKFSTPQVEFVSDSSRLDDTRNNSTGSFNGRERFVSITGGLGTKLDLIRGYKEKLIIAASAELLNYQQFYKDNQVPVSVDQERYITDLINAIDCNSIVFDKVSMKSSSANFVCNLTFDYVQDPLGKGFLKADMLLRTPIFNQKLSEMGRIYVEGRVGNLGLRPAGMVFVGASATYRTYSVAVDAYKEFACIAYTESDTNRIKYRLFKDDVAVAELFHKYSTIRNDQPFIAADNALAQIDNVGSITVSSSGGADTLVRTSVGSFKKNFTDIYLDDSGYDKIIGDLPDYYRGRDIYISNAAWNTFLKTQTGVEVEPRQHINFTVLSGAYFDNPDGDGQTFYRDVVATTAIDTQIYMGKAIVEGEITFTTVDETQTIINGETGQAGEFVFTVQDAKFISVVAPYSKRIIDRINLTFTGPNINSTGSNKFRAEIFLDYIEYQSLQLRLLPAALAKNVTFKLVDYLTGEEYRQRAYTSNVVSCGFDLEQKLYIFYEDSNAQNGYYSIKDFKNNTVINADGTHIPDILETIKKNNNLNDKQVQEVVANNKLITTRQREISCLMTPDLGGNWYDFKAVVRTAGFEEVSNPRVFIDTAANSFNLFYTINSNLFMKKMDASAFDVRDAFLGYARPTGINYYTPAGYGLYHFSSRGRSLRESVSKVVIALDNGQFIKTQTAVSAAFVNAGRPDLRFSFSGQYSFDTQGMAEVDYFVFRNKIGLINLLYAFNGKLFCRQSSDNGNSWFNLTPAGLSIHRNVIFQESRAIQQLGFAYDDMNERLLLTYRCDNMIFTRILNAEIRKLTEDTKAKYQSTLARELDYENNFNIPIFITGTINGDILPYMENKGIGFVFPYGKYQWDKFSGDDFAAASVPCLGYPLSDGRIRLFYMDANENLRGITYETYPVFDSTLKNLS